MKKIVRGTRGMADGGVAKAASLTDREIASARTAKIAGPATKNYVNIEAEYRNMKQSGGGFSVDAADSYKARAASKPKVQPAATPYSSRFESVRDDDTLRNAPQGETGRGLAQEIKARSGLRKRDIDAATGYANGGKVVKRRMANGGPVQTAVPPPRPGYANGGKMSRAADGDDRGGPAGATSGLVVRSGTGSMVRIGRGDDPLESRGFGVGRIMTGPAKISESNIRAAETAKRNAQMADHLGMSVEAYGRAKGMKNGGMVGRKKAC